MKLSRRSIVAILLAGLLSLSSVIQPFAVYAGTSSEAEIPQIADESGQADFAEDVVVNNDEATNQSPSDDVQPTQGVSEQGGNVDAVQNEAEASEDISNELVGETSSVVEVNGEKNSVASADSLSVEGTSSDWSLSSSWRVNAGTYRTDLDSGVSVFAMDTPPAGASLQGVDVSSHQGDIDWARVKAAGIDFAILRVGFGSEELDNKFIDNVRGCKANGIPFGVYLYSYAWDVTSAKWEGDGTVARLQQAGVNPGDLSLPVYYDLENQNPNTGRPCGVDGNGNRIEIQGGPATFTNMVSTFASALESSGYQVGVYANLTWWNNYLTSPVFNQWDRWVAQYYSSCTYQGEYGIWQYTSTGSVPGISGGVDLNWYYGIPDTSNISVTASTVNGTSIEVKSEGYASAPSNVAFRVSLNGTTKWYQAYKQNDGSWSAGINVVRDFSNFGSYDISAWVTYGFSTQRVASTRISLSPGKASLIAESSGTSISAAASGWTLSPKNVAFKVSSPSGAARWYQAYRQADGSWSAEVPALADFKAWGAYAVEAWATFETATDAYAISSVSLSPGEVSVATDVSGGSVSASASGWALSPKNVAFEVRSPSGSARWYQAYERDDGSWGAEVPAYSDFGEAGSYAVRAWATIDGVTLSIASSPAELSAGDAASSAAIEDGAIRLSASGWTLPPKNVAFKVSSPSGAARWYQAYRQADGSWAADIPAGADFGEWGEYRAAAYATHGGSTRAYGSASVVAAEPEPEVLASASGTSISASASGWTLSPKNVAFKVSSPSGAARWYQAYRQADGSWSAEVPAGANFGEWGTYSVQCWTTFGSRTAAYGPSSISNIERVSISYSARRYSGSWVDASDGNQASSWNGSSTEGFNAFSVRVQSSPVAGSVSYQGYVPGSGWTALASNGSNAGPDASKKRLSGIKVSVSGDLSSYCDIWYRVYVNSFGWLGWTKNGSLAGTTNLDLQVQSIEIVALPKDSAAPGSTSNAYLVTYPYIGFQNPSGYYQVSNKSVSIPHLGEGIFGYRTESRIPYNASKNDCINAMIQRAYEYIGTSYVWDYACAPGVGVDCAGLVMQCLYATGMDLSPMNPWDHYYQGLSGGWHSAYANYMWNHGKFQRLSFSQRKRGDIVSWKGHVAIYIGNNQIIEATGNRVRISSVYSWGTPRGVLRPFV